MSPRLKSGILQLFPPASAELRQLRQAADLSQTQLAERVGYAAKTITRWENGRQPPREGVIEYLRTLSRSRTVASKEADGALRFIDLFAGIGGLRMGFEAVGGSCVFTSEWDPHCQKTYRANFGDEHISGDIVQIASEHIPEHDVLLAGFPCQPFSIAGVSKKNALGRPHGFECDTQGTLFFEVERILKARRPKAFLLENVKHLINHDGGKTFRTILRVLERDLEYRVWWKVIDAQCFVPQHRERVFIVGFRDDTNFDWSHVAMPPNAHWPKLETVLHPEDGTEAPERPYTDEKGRVSRKYVLSTHLWQYLRDYAAKHRAQGNGFGFGLVGPNDVARTLSARYFKDGSEILIGRGRGNPRRLTPRECARLMGFDRPGKPFVIPVSDTQSYKQFGNSVVVPIVEAIARAMKPCVLSQGSSPEQLSLELAVAR